MSNFITALSTSATLTVFLPISQLIAIKELLRQIFLVLLVWREQVFSYKALFVSHNSVLVLEIYFNLIGF